jgi:hypothetical protein
MLVRRGVRTAVTSQEFARSRMSFTSSDRDARFGGQLRRFDRRRLTSGLKLEMDIQPIRWHASNLPGNRRTLVSTKLKCDHHGRKLTEAVSAAAGALQHQLRPRRCANPCLGVNAEERKRPAG